MSITAALFLLAFAGTAILAFARAPIYGLYGYVAIFYLDPVNRWWGADLPDFRWSLIAGVVTLMATLRIPASPARPAWLKSTPAMYLLLMGAWLWAQNLWALEADLHLEVSILFTKYVVLFYLMYRLLDSEDALWGFLRAHVLGCLYLGWLVAQAPDAGRLEGVGGPGIDEANALGMHIGTGAFAAAALLFDRPWWSRLLGLASIPLILNGIIQTESRGAFLAILAGGLAFLYFNRPRTRRTLIVLGMVGLVALLPRIPENFWERMSSISTTADSNGELQMDSDAKSADVRLSLMRAQWQMFLRYPMGSGHRGTAALSPKYLSDDELTSTPGSAGQRARSSHNTFLTILAEQGIPGVILFVTLCVWILRTSRTLKGRMASLGSGPGPGPGNQGILLATVVATLTVALVAGLFTDYFKAEVFVWGTALLACMSALGEEASVTAGNDVVLQRDSTQLDGAGRQPGNATT